jgi:hypothetical protein
MLFVGLALIQIAEHDDVMTVGHQAVHDAAHRHCRRRRSAPPPPDCDLKWLTGMWSTAPDGVVISLSGQSRLKITPSSSTASTWERIEPISKPSLVMIPTSIQRSSLPSSNIT